MLNGNLIRNSLLNKDTVVFCREKSVSTNTEARKLIAEGFDNFVITADEQTDGRGRGDNSFYSPAGSGIYFSFVVPCSYFYQSSFPLSCITAVCVCDAIEKMCSLSLKIKWVNDIYLDDKKVCGILIEKALIDGLYYYIIGIGVNITTSDFPDSLAGIAGSLGVDIDKNVLVADIINNLTEYYSGDFYDEYKLRSCIIGRTIFFKCNGKLNRGVVSDIGSDAALFVTTDTGVLELRSGTVEFENNFDGELI